MQQRYSKPIIELKKSKHRPNKLEFFSEAIPHKIQSGINLDSNFFL